MGYQWGAPTAVTFNVKYDDTEISAFKNDAAGSLTLRFRLSQVDFEGDNFPTDQTFADIFGVIAVALEGDGFTVQVTEPGSASRDLEEVP